MYCNWQVRIQGAMLLRILKRRCHVTNSSVVDIEASSPGLIVGYVFEILVNVHCILWKTFHCNRANCP
jgi:hypothetical protein